MLLNILPASVVQELEATGESKPRQFENVTILFTDFKGFTELVASIPVITLIKELNDIYSHFDIIMDQVGLEKIETIGDAYLAASGLPTPAKDHGVKCMTAAKQMLAYLDKRNNDNEIQWKMRIGIHSGPVAAGVVGKRKFRYNVFGDTVNTAARMESNSEPGRINISASTYDLVKETYHCTHRGKVFAKGKGDIDMYFVE